MLSDSELEQMRADQLATMTETATVTRRSTVSDGAGGGVQTETTFTLPCRRTIMRAGQGEALASGQFVQGQNWRVTFPALSDIRQGDGLTIDGKRYEVIAVLGPKTRGTALPVYCKEV